MMKVYSFAALALLLSLATTVRAQTINWTDPDALAVAAVETAPRIGELDRRFEAVRERSRGASAQPNPMLMAGVQDLMVNLEQDEMMTMYMAGASQTFVSGAKRRAARSAIEAEAASLESQRASLAAEISREVHFAWNDVATLDSSILAVEEVLLLSDAVIAAARVRYEVGSAIQADVIRAQLVKSTNTHSLIALRSNRRTAAAQLVAAMNVPASTEVPRIVLQHAKGSVATAESFEITDAHAAITAAVADVQRYERLIDSARLATRPDFGVEASYGYRPMQTDMFSVVGTVELPIRRKSRIEPAIRAAVAEREAAEQRVEELRRILQRDLNAARISRDETAKQLEFHDQVLVPQSRLAVESSLAAYQTGRTSFDSILGALNQYLALRLEYFDYLNRHNRALADLDALAAGARAGATFGGARSSGAAATQTTSESSSMSSM